MAYLTDSPKVLSAYNPVKITETSSLSKIVLAAVESLRELRLTTCDSLRL